MNLLISCADESDTFHDIMSSRTEKFLELTKEKNDLSVELKKFESQIHMLETEIKEFEEN